MSGRIAANGTTTKVEFDVQMTCESCGSTVRKALEETKGVKSYTIDVPKQSVVIESELPSESLRLIIENTGIKAVVKGIGSSAEEGDLGAAVAEIRSSCGIYGVVRFHQVSKDECVVDGTFDGLSEGEHGLHIHEYGDLSDGCSSLGEHFNPTNKRHGGRLSEDRHYGDLGNIAADATGRASFLFKDHIVKVRDIIGRSLAITAGRDDLGQGESEDSKLNGNSGESLACGVIARSAGLFENPKRLCQCDGVTVWEERNITSYGQSQSSKNS